MAKRTQTLIAIIVAVLMLASLFILASCVEQEQEHDCVDINEDNTCDTCGNTLAKLLYTLKEDNTYEVSGYEETPTKVVIPATYNNKSVTSIGDDAFFVCTSLTSVTIPNSVTSIGERSFDLCYSLTSVTIGNSVTSIGDDAFAGCTSLTSITIPNSVTSIGDDAFWHCNALVSITIPNSVTSIGRAAFRYCYSLTSVTIGNSVTSIGEDAFEGCDKLIEVYNLSSLNIKKGSDNNGYVGYYAKDIYTSLNTPSKVSTDSNGYIIYTDGEEKILIGYVGNETALTLPNGITSIYKYAFFVCRSLTSVTIPNSVTSIGDDAFAYCTSLTSVTIPDSVTSIGESAFDGCNNLVYNVKDNVKYLGNSDNLYLVAMEMVDNTVTSLTISDSCKVIGFSAFSKCTSLTSITIPNSVTSIEDSAFSKCTSLTSVTIPNSVTSIGDYAFGNCFSLTSITIPNSVTSIGDCAFWGCTSLTSITFEDTTDWYRTTSKTDWQNKTGGTLVDVTNPTNNDELFVDNYYNYYWYKK